MFDGIFDAEEDDYSSPTTTNYQYKRLPRTCAHYLDIPDKERVAGTPVGLKNQGCTCYLNSLLQILFFTPEFRNVIYKIPLFKQTLEQPTGYLDQESKTKFVLGFQQLFAQMQLLDCKSVGTTNLSDAFGWKQGQQAEQHDINESMIVILQTLQRALNRTEFEGQIRDSFKIIMKKYIKCLNCNQTRNRESEQLFQLLTYVKNKKTLHEGITSLLEPEVVEGVECQKEGSKQNAQMGQAIHNLPQVLVITLGRFDFDYQSMQRVKLTDKFVFDLEMNIGQYLEHPQDMDYELYGVLIHGGSAHAGHYVAYIRDIMQQADWNNSYKIQQEQQQRQKEKREKEKEGKLQNTAQPLKKKPNQEQKNKQTSKLKDPNNPELLKNWYELNDSCVSPIEASKIATQFEGGQSAYILFYRRVSNAPLVVVQPPEYLKAQVREKNKMAKEKRQFYNTESEHIHLIINDQTYRTNINQTIGSLLEKYCPQGSSLINKQDKNDLPYYPMELNHNKNLDETISKADLVHESKWFTVPMDSEQYKQIRDLVGIEKVPITITVLFQNDIYPIVTHTDKKFIQLRLEFENKFKVGYEKQIIKLINEIGREVFLTDDILNDDLTLGKLKFINLSQVNLNYLKEEDKKEETKTEVPEQHLGILSFAVERDDALGMKRYYVKQTMTLEEAFEYFKKAEGITDDYKRRIRWTNRNRLFSVDQYSKQLKQFPYEESIIKIKIERGEIPVKGDICVKVRNQSKYQTQNNNKKFLEIMQDPNQTLKKLKQQVCAYFELDPAQHKMYRTDWLEEPTRPIVKENQTLFESNFAQEQLLILRDLDSKLAAELIHLNLHLTKTGFPDDCQKMFTFTTQETKTLKQVKESLMAVPLISELLGENPSEKRIRLRELKRNYMFGTILRNPNKTLKANGLEQYNVVVQVLPNEEQLGEGDIVLATRHRDSVNRLYLDQTEFIFRGSKAPTLSQLKEAFLNWKGLELPEDELRFFKYYLHDLQWVEWSDKLYKKWIEMRQKNSKAKSEQKAKQKENDKKIKQQNNKKKENKKKEQDKNQQHKPQTEQSDTLKKEENKDQKPEQVEVEQKKPENAEKGEIKDNEKQKKQPKQPKQPKPPKQPKIQQNKKKNQKQDDPKEGEEQNLRKVPFLLKDGDIIGFGFNSQMLPNDDLQTEDDDNLRLLQFNERKKIKGSRHVKENPFQFVLDF